MNLGITFADLGDYQGAVSALKTAVELRDNWFPANLELGVAYYQLRDFDNAVKYLNKAVKLNDKFPPALDFLKKAKKAQKNSKN